MSASASAQTRGDYLPSEVSTYYSVRVPDLVQRGAEWRGPCPIHGGHGDNFTVNADTGCWCCHSQCGRGGSMYDFEMLVSNTEFAEASNEVRRIVGRPAFRKADCEPEKKWGLPGWSHSYLRERIEKVESDKSWKHSATYPYFRADGSLAGVYS